ncbi:MAG TPA: nickel-dependent lactate racemase [Pyrinomonadaceae bacterium]|jgi:nickel-dependent lactate racemase|nr:nickel-dependent lactate racemase [Pyrinomonadaceae bacterium]
MNIELGYGRASLSLRYDAARFRVLAPVERDDAPLSDVLIGEAFDAPLASPLLEEIVSPGESVLIVASDATRATASAQIIHLLVRRLIALGVSSRDIRIVFATGIHRRVTPEEKRELLTPFIVQRIKTFSHDAVDESKLVPLGTTERGTQIELDRALVEHDHVILTGAIGFHYFAGFTGGRKAVCPGLASVRTIEATHMLALDFETGGRRAGVGTGLLEGNAVHEECERIAAEAAPSFLINTVTDGRGRALRVYCGDWRAAHRTACEEYALAHSLPIDARRAVVIASCGGAPWDINLIQAHKTLDMAAHACTEGGSIILVAECADGLGRPDFLKWFEEKGSRALADRLRMRYEVNGQTAWSLLVKAESFRVHLVSELADEDVRRMRMTPARTIDEALAQIDGGAEGYIMPRGAVALPVVA